MGEREGWNEEEVKEGGMRGEKEERGRGRG